MLSIYNMYAEAFGNRLCRQQRSEEVLYSVRLRDADGGKAAAGEAFAHQGGRFVQEDRCRQRQHSPANRRGRDRHHGAHQLFIGSGKFRVIKENKDDTNRYSGKSRQRIPHGQY